MARIRHVPRNFKLVYDYYHSGNVSPFHWAAFVCATFRLPPPVQVVKYVPPPIKRKRNIKSSSVWDLPRPAIRSFPKRVADWHETRAISDDDLENADPIENKPKKRVFKKKRSALPKKVPAPRSPNSRRSPRLVATA